MNQGAKKTWVIPADFGERFPDGDYTVGRGADPRGAAEREAETAAEADKAPRGAKASPKLKGKKPARPAAAE